MHVKTWMAPVALVLVAAGLSTLGTTTAGAAPVPRPAAAHERGPVGSWTKISTGTGSITYQASLYRTPDGVLHVVYPKIAGADTVQLGHTTIQPAGGTVLQNKILPTDWANVDLSPIVIGDGGDGVRAVFGGQQSAVDSFWSHGRLYTATAPESGDPWTLPAEAVGESTEAYGSLGTAATSLADGTPVAAFPLHSDITWHVGTAETPDQSFTVSSGDVSDMAMVRDGDAVWVAWFVANGGSAAATGTFVRQILPTLGPTLKAPQSSVGDGAVPTRRVALVARSGGGVYAAYCTGFPYCSHIGLWKVGTSKVLKVPATLYADHLAASPGPSGRIWLAWSDNIPNVHAVRTNKAGTKLGAGRLVGMPPDKTAVYSLAIDGTVGLGDVVINVGDDFWHTQVAPGLTLKAKPGKWKHGRSTKVTFTVSDAGDKVPGATVKAGSKKCKTTSRGTCAITFSKKTKAGQLVAKASKSGYGAGSTRLKVQ